MSIQREFLGLLTFGFQLLVKTNVAEKIVEIPDLAFSDVIYHPIPINSQYLKILGVDSPHFRHMLNSKENHQQNGTLFFFF